MLVAYSISAMASVAMASSAAARRNGENLAGGWHRGVLANREGAAKASIKARGVAAK